MYFVAAECYFELRRRLSRLARTSRSDSAKVTTWSHFSDKLQILFIGIEVHGLITHGRNSENESASYFTTITVTLHRKHDTTRDYVTFNSTYVTFTSSYAVMNSSYGTSNDESFQWKVGSVFKHGRIALKMSHHKAEAEIYFGEKIRIKVIRHIRRRKLIDGSKFSFLGIYVMRGTQLTNSSSGFLGKNFKLLTRISKKTKSFRT